VAAGPRAPRVFAVVEPTFPRSIQTQRLGLTGYFEAQKLWARPPSTVRTESEIDHDSLGRWADALRPAGLLAGTIARDAVVDQGIAEEALAR
jgi:hypothetical protein